MKRGYSILLLAFLALVVVLTFQSAGAQTWFNSSWPYRIPVAIAGTGSMLTDHQVKITLDASFAWSHASTDGADVRITGSDGTTLLPFWIESWNSAAQQATLWTKVPSLPTTGTTVYLYYGNALAGRASNGTSTFSFFDDFTDPDSAGLGNWIRILNYPWGTGGYVSHDWKYSMEMQQGALYFSLLRAQNGWGISSLDTSIEREYYYIHSQINPDGSTIGTHNEPQYEYGVTLSNLASRISIRRLLRHATAM
jgi:hypothetical protein